ncbi:tigger transposable element-derived protein 1-like [Plakobranchus ocellatus]|uniref:Tigger transposable element-derived protein 1-like n=1 Tax=Plakobranchus ocellatus TaxID=259542 RepID=A0AAV4B3C7_9GAST|nr:tigger transposable element-derived protein 1-like [Plakobranchus ocellatus]
MFNKEYKKAGRTWVEAFFQRHPEVPKRRAQPMNQVRALKLNKYVVQDNFQKLEIVTKRLDVFGKPNQIDSLNEKLAALILHKQQIVHAKKGDKCVYLESQKILKMLQLWDDLLLLDNLCFL